MCKELNMRKQLNIYNTIKYEKQLSLFTIITLSVY